MAMIAQAFQIWVMLLKGIVSGLLVLPDFLVLVSAGQRL